jgi:hypothetical protein
MVRDERVGKKKKIGRDERVEKKNEERREIERILKKKKKIIKKPDLSPFLAYTQQIRLLKRNEKKN